MQDFKLSTIDKIGLGIIFVLIAALLYFTRAYGDVKHDLNIEQSRVVKLNSEVDSLNEVIREIEMFSEQDSIYRDEIISLTNEISALKRKSIGSPKFDPDTQIDGLNIVVRHKINEQFKDER